jgi:LysM repeat protein
VQRGENLAQIAKKYGTSIAQLRKANSLRSNVIHAGANLKVGGSSRDATSDNIVTAAPSPKRTGAIQEHIVRNGETLFQISKKYNLTISYLKRVNGLSNASLRAGQRLKIQVPIASARSASSTTKYKVRRGDSLAAIASKFGTTVAAIKQLNRLQRNHIYAGQILRIVN